MKAWLVGDRRANWQDEFCILIHAETREKARKISIDIWPDYYSLEYKNIRAVRVPELDDKPFIIENVKPTGIYRDVDEQPIEWYWHNFCPCKICYPS